MRQGVFTFADLASNKTRWTRAGSVLIMYHYYFSEQDTGHRTRHTAHRTGGGGGGEWVLDTPNREIQQGKHIFYVYRHTHSQTPASLALDDSTEALFCWDFLPSPSKHEMLHLEMSRLNTLAALP